MITKGMFKHAIVMIRSLQIELHKEKAENERLRKQLRRMGIAYRSAVSGS